MKVLPDICVVGTDTGVGKSVVSLLLMQLLFDQGYRPYYLKPFQTGCVDASDAASDAAFVYRHTAALRHKDPARSVVYCFPNPKAPYFAACDAGESIDMEKVRREIQEKGATHSPLVVEAAGGLLVPVTEKHTVMDLLSLISGRPLLVARAGLGTINHTLLSIEALRSRKADPVGVVLVESAPLETAPDMVAENMAAIEHASGIQVGGAIPAIADFSAPPAKAVQPLKNLLL